jgi:tricarballylate dehydrogenase
LASGRADVLVAGGGNAAVCAALAAAEAGARVLMLERADEAWPGGNSKYTRNVRVAHGRDSRMPGEYDEAEFPEDLRRVSGKGLDSDFAAFTIDASRGLPAWMEAHGIRWQPALSGTLGLARTNRFFLGGGKALVNEYYRQARARGIRVIYGATVEGFDLDAGRFRAARVNIEARPRPSKRALSWWRRAASSPTWSGSGGFGVTRSTTTLFAAPRRTTGVPCWRCLS